MCFRWMYSVRYPFMSMFGFVTLKILLRKNRLSLQKKVLDSEANA